NMDALEDLTALYEKLPDNRYRIYLIMEDGSARIILDVQLRNGQPVDPSATDDEQPERPAVNAVLADDQSPSNAQDTIDSTSKVEEINEQSDHAIEPALIFVNELPVEPNSDSATSDATETVATATSVLAGTTVFLRNRRARKIRRDFTKESAQPFSKSARRLRSIERAASS
ncbi:MAG: hypothetical protein KDB27_09830, partial [Planctomycetales bacterium]|nr:hypothetical protein [Planctomycetales bacterium]